MVTGFCLSNQYSMVDVRARRCDRFGNRHDLRRFPGHPCSTDESGKGIAERMRALQNQTLHRILINEWVPFNRGGRYVCFKNLSGIMVQIICPWSGHLLSDYYM